MIFIGGLSALLSYFYAVTVGLGELPINFSKHYNASILGIAVMTSWACWTGDTLATEVRLTSGRISPHLISTFGMLPLRANEAIAILGTLTGAVGGLLIGITYYLSLCLCTSSSIWSNYPPQWPLMLCSACAGFLESIIRSYLTTSTRFFVQCQLTENILFYRIQNVRDVASANISKTGCLGLLSTFITSCIICYTSIKIWPTN
ncbi:Transmembrane protein 19 [Trichoplax sp. H2]|nr:Transmembrane protein 19 [Trichoplax sp. H2]|eukprot:RDD41160.1 Transmembrane protein 19 [Trichoplax sp. H2]